MAYNVIKKEKRPKKYTYKMIPNARKLQSKSFTI